MDIQKEFKKWYATEGVRNLLPKGEHWHEHYSKVAFIAGISAYAEHINSILDKNKKDTQK